MPTAELLEASIGQTAIVVQDSGDNLMLTVKRVRRAATSHVGDDSDDPSGRAAFSVDLRGPVDPVLAPMTYPVTLPGSETMHLFVSPYHQDATETFYEIVFSDT